MRFKKPVAKVAATLAISSSLLAGFAPAQAVNYSTPVSTNTSSSSELSFYAYNRTPVNRLVSLNLPAQAQQQTLWCWAASGAMAANYLRAGVTQNEFCNLAKMNGSTYHSSSARNTPCVNNTGDFNDIARGFEKSGIYGSTLKGQISFDTIKREIDAKRPILVRIQWPSGDGHCMMIEGYNDATEQIQWINPWKPSQRVTVDAYSTFANNANFKWTHSITNIGGNGNPRGY